MESVACNVCHGMSFARALLWVRKDEYASRLGRLGGRSQWVMCRACGLVFQNPRPDAQDASILYAESVYRSEIKDSEVEENMEFHFRRPMNAIKWLYEQPEFESLSRVPDNKVLDIGSGYGAALVRFRELGWDPDGVEPDPGCARYAESRFSVPTKTEFLTESTWRDTNFLFMFSQHAFEHMSDPLAVAKVARTLLDKEQGLIFICVPTYRRTWSFSWPNFNTSHTYIFTHKTLGNLLSRAGFSVLGYRYFSKWDREGEVWVLAKADRSPTEIGEPGELPFWEDVWSSQCELALVPLFAFLGFVSRFSLNCYLLIKNPREFYQTSRRFRMLFDNPKQFFKKVKRKLVYNFSLLRLQFVRERRLNQR